MENKAREAKVNRAWNIEKGRSKIAAYNVSLLLKNTPVYIHSFSHAMRPFLTFGLLKN